MENSKSIIRQIENRKEAITIKQLSDMILEHVNAGIELIINESLHFGMGLYAYTSDLQLVSGCHFAQGLNPLFSHLQLSVENIAHVLTYLYNGCGYIEISGTPIQLNESISDAQPETLPTTRPEVQLKEEDKDKMKQLNRKNDYCLPYVGLFTLCEKHEKAFARKDFYTCSLIEYRLTDINFHSECGMLYAGQYNELKKEIKKEEAMKATNNALYVEIPKSQIQLLPENITLQMIADGILVDKESTNIAKRIIAEGMQEQFDKFRSKDKYANGSLMDLFDTVVNFPIHNAEIYLYGDCTTLSCVHFSGMKPEESLLKLFDYANDIDCEIMDECSFKLRGVKGFLPYNSYLFHQCFAEGRITVDELIKILQEQED